MMNSSDPSKKPVASARFDGMLCRAWAGGIQIDVERSRFIEMEPKEAREMAEWLREAADWVEVARAKS